MGVTELMTDTEIGARSNSSTRGFFAIGATLGSAAGSIVAARMLVPPAAVGDSTSSAIICFFLMGFATADSPQPGAPGARTEAPESVAPAAELVVPNREVTF